MTGESVEQKIEVCIKLGFGIACSCGGHDFDEVPITFAGQGTEAGNCLLGSFACFQRERTGELGLRNTHHKCRYGTEGNEQCLT